jgi:hypothetical protein
VTETAQLLAGGVIDRDLYCVECAYNLRGLDPAGRCPECGNDISLSLRDDLLRFASAGWLKTVRRGFIFMYYALTFGFLLGFASVSAVGVAPVANRGQGWLLAFGVGLMTVAGVYLTTTPDPRAGLSEPGKIGRDVVRAFAIINLIGIIVAAAAEQAGIMSIAGLAEVMGALAAVVLVFGYFGCLVRLSARIPDSKLGKSARTAKWGLAIAHALGVALPASSWVTGFAASPTAGPVRFSSTLRIGAGLLYLIFLIRGLRVLLGFRKAFKAALKEACGPGGNTAPTPS